MPEDGNKQDMSVLEVENAALAATEEAQDVARLPSIIVPVPSYTDPNNPVAAAGSINMSLDTHPVEHSEDYGANVENGMQVVHTVMDTHALDQAGEGAKAQELDAPEDRADWQKKHWQAQARNFGLATSGNIAKLKERVEAYEADLAEAKQMNAEDWKNEIAQMNDTDELDELRELYDASGAEFSTVAEAFDARQAELAEQS